MKRIRALVVLSVVLPAAGLISLMTMPSEACACIYSAEGFEYVEDSWGAEIEATEMAKAMTARDHPLAAQRWRLLGAQRGSAKLEAAFLDRLKDDKYREQWLAHMRTEHEKMECLLRRAETVAETPPCNIKGSDASRTGDAPTPGAQSPR